MRSVSIPPTDRTASERSRMVNPAKTYKKVNRYTVSHIMTDIRVGDTFESWPMHITLLPWFRAREYEAISGFMATVDDMEVCNGMLGERALGSTVMYGAGDVSVRPVRDSTPIGVVQGLLLARFRDKIIDPSYTAGAFSPHVDIRQADPGEGFTFALDSLCLIRRDDKNKLVVGAEKLRVGSRSE